MLFERSHASGSLLVTRSGGEASNGLRGRHASAGDALMTRVADTCQALRLDRAEDHPRHAPAFDVLPTQRAGFLCAPLRRGHVQGAVAVAGATNRPFGPDDLSVLVRLAQQAAVGLESVAFGERVTNFVTHTAELLFSILDRVDAALTGHSRATARLTDMLTRRLGLPDGERRAAHFAALLHDVGKLGLSGLGHPPDRPDPSWALELLRPVTWWQESLAPIALHRHPWDGHGRPGQAAGSDLPLSARVLAIACEFDHALRRAGHEAQAPERALRALQEAAGSRLDPRLVRLFCAEYRARAHDLPPDAWLSNVGATSQAALGGALALADRERYAC